MKTTRMAIQMTGIGRTGKKYFVMGNRYNMGRLELALIGISEETYMAFHSELKKAKVELTEEPVTAAGGDSFIYRMPDPDDITSERAFAVVSGRAMIQKTKHGRTFTMVEDSAQDGPLLDIAVAEERGFGGEKFRPRRKAVSTLEALAYKVHGSKARIRTGSGYSAATMRNYKAFADLSLA